MREIQVEIDRLEITLEGVPASVAEEAILGIDAELQRLLARGLWRAQPGVEATEIPAISMIQEAAGQDPAALRQTISQRLAERIARLAAPETEGV